MDDTYEFILPELPNTLYSLSVHYLYDYVDELRNKYGEKIRVYDVYS
jgi:hypothetical protein